MKSGAAYRLPLQLQKYPSGDGRWSEITNGSGLVKWLKKFASQKE
jgi:hypothetical protein